MLRREPYISPSYLIPQARLEVHIRANKECIVRAWLKLRKNRQVTSLNPLHQEPSRVISDPQAHQAPHRLELDGVGLKLHHIQIDGSPLPSQHYELQADKLIIHEPKEEFELFTEVSIDPWSNTSLEGFYASGDYLMTQCEPQGFRKITYFIDRPDVLTQFDVQLTAPKSLYPVLLSNGNLLEQKESNDEYRVLWRDPFPKPCYLFAMVAGPFEKIEAHHITSSGRRILLEAYTPTGESHKAAFALESLKQSMAWEEKTYGLEYDLDRYMIVSTHDFNAGAMENKGLNVFNSRLILAHPKIANDDNFYMVQSVVAHEYLHNYSGNRVTLRDWFNLSLKEGLTVFRDQEFSSSQHDPAIVRIMNIQNLKATQFPEDQGPNRHAVYPREAKSMENLFSHTIYEKGAEIIRMVKNLLGAKAFNHRLREYFLRFDGQAVTILDLMHTLLENSLPLQHPEFDLSHFLRWYELAGTPLVTAKWQTQGGGVYELSLWQQDKKPLDNPSEFTQGVWLIPLRLDFSSKEGKPLSFGNHVELLSGQAPFINADGHSYLFLKQAQQSWTFKAKQGGELYAGLNAGFSAPVELKWERTEQEVLRAFRSEQDGVNKWLLSEELWILLFQGAWQDHAFVNDWIAEWRQALAKPEEFSHLKSYLLQWPDPLYVTTTLGEWRPQLLQEIYLKLAYDWARALAQDIPVAMERLVTHSHQKDSGTWQAQAMGLRRLKNKILSLWFIGENIAPQKLKDFGYSIPEPTQAQTSPSLAWAKTQLQKATELTDLEAAASLLVELESERASSLEFFLSWNPEDPLHINKWFRLQAASWWYPHTWTEVKNLTQHPLWLPTNPNRVYSLLRVFGQNSFHALDSEPCAWLLSQVMELDPINPSVASRVGGFVDAFTWLPKTQRRAIQERVRPIWESKKSSLSQQLVDVLEKALLSES
jgi:aminopeptidase N